MGKVFGEGWPDVPQSGLAYVSERFVEKPVETKWEKVKRMFGFAANDKVNPVAGSNEPQEQAKPRNSGASDCSFSVIGALCY